MIMLMRVLCIAIGVAACIALILISAPHVMAQTTEGGYKIFRPEGRLGHTPLWSFWVDAAVILRTLRPSIMSSPQNIFELKGM